jgi:hypothetical protein
MAMGADYSFELISIETYAFHFIGHNKLFLGSVNLLLCSISFLISQINEETCDLHNILPIFSTIQCFQQTKQCISSFLASPLLEPIFSPPKDIFDSVHSMLKF